MLSEEASERLSKTCSESGVSQDAFQSVHAGRDAVREKILNERRCLICQD